MEFLQAYAITLAIEGMVLYFILRKQYAVTEIVKNSVLASTITLPFVWFVFPLSGLSWFYVTAISEVFAVIVETWIYKTTFRKISWRMAFGSSFVCNVASFVIGLLLN